MIKKMFYMALALALVACEDKTELTHRYSKVFYKEYPIYLDAREILVDIQVKPSVPIDAAFKIVSNDKYFFVGEKMKGIHVYKRTDISHANPLCFIECKYLKALDVTDNLLYCNNFVDLLVIDVEDPLKAKILHRGREFFNSYYSYPYLNFPVSYNYSIQADVYFLGSKQVSLTAIVTDDHPDPDFSELDELYGNLIVKEIPDTLQLDYKPCAGIVNVEGSIFTLGSWNIVQCFYTPGWGVSYSETSLINNYSSFMPIDKLLYKDGMLFILGFNWYGLYLDYSRIYRQGFVYMNSLKDMAFTTQPTNRLVFLNQNYQYQDYQNYQYQYFQLQGYILDEYYNILSQMNSLYTTATSLIYVDDTILALSDQTITLYDIEQHDYDWGYSYYGFKEVKQYPFGGATMLKEGDRLIVANPQGLFIYDISNLNNIVRIP